jgi:hypothetical protein
MLCLVATHSSLPRLDLMQKPPHAPDRFELQGV